MDLKKIGTTELIKLKNEITEELHRREMNKTAVVWAIPGEKGGKTETPTDKSRVLYRMMEDK